MALRAQSKACSTFGPRAPAPTARAGACRRATWRQAGQSAPAEAPSKPAEETARIAAAMEDL
eukprot:6488130-Pyramimonas_sp.AAC.1